MEFRKLSDSEITILKNQNCNCSNWDDINVRMDFKPDNIYNSKFSGVIHIESFEKKLKFDSGLVRHTGIFDSVLYNCYVGTNSLINNVKLIANYNIGENVIIDNVNNLTVTGKTAFGNGTQIEILNEGGGRELKIFDKLSSQLAYLIVTRRERTKFIENANELIDKYVDSISSETGIIGNNSQIINCNYINNVKFGDYSIIRNALYLEEGTISSNQQAPVIIGEGVSAKSFIISSGSKIDGQSMIEKTFVGQGVKIGKQFSAENSAFFANCEGFHGEACSVFAGPYSVTHHKSTLLIAGMFSFYNAGSGSNQSNHLYKLGPVHQGLLERGSKTGSFSYLMWPCRTGAFTGIIGKHYSNFDTSDFPFSYILELNGKSLLMPAMNLCTVGTKRDSAKWPKRDRRKDNLKHDRMNFELFSPYVVSKIINGIRKLENVISSASDESLIELEGVFIKKSKISEAIKKYNLVIDIFIGDAIINETFNGSTILTIGESLNNLSNSTNKELEKWIDVSGMFSPESLIDNLLESIENSDLKNIVAIEKELDKIFENYSTNAFQWCLDLINKYYEKQNNRTKQEDIINIIESWKAAKIAVNNLILEDAKKEFQDKIKISFGVDGNQKRIKKDFEAVRGKFEENSFIKNIYLENKKIEKTAEDIKDTLNNK